LIALDTSVIIPALTDWHEADVQARLRAKNGRVPVHALLKGYSES
jgi:hypothetical protein